MHVATLDPKPPTDRQHVETVHELLRSSILRGEIPAGAITTQAALAAQLDVGRTPLREALRMLQSEGLVVSERNRQVQIADLSSDDAEQLYVMRIALETAAIRITVPTLTSDAFAEFEGLMAQMDHYMRVGDQPGMRAPHRRFHRTLVAAAGGRVSRVISELFDHGAVAPKCSR
jgi:DNA-binding GntR family transcriptional regulator